MRGMELLLPFASLPGLISALMIQISRLIEKKGCRKSVSNPEKDRRLHVLTLDLSGPGFHRVVVICLL
jgi:hypothetical protein